MHDWGGTEAIVTFVILVSPFRRLEHDGHEGLTTGTRDLLVLPSGIRRDAPHSRFPRFAVGA
jgi:hypothetical protein